VIVLQILTFDSAPGTAPKDVTFCWVRVGLGFAKGRAGTRQTSGRSCGNSGGWRSRGIPAPRDPRLCQSRDLHARGRAPQRRATPSELDFCHFGAHAKAYKQQELTTFQSFSTPLETDGLQKIQGPLRITSAIRALRTAENGRSRAKWEKCVVCPVPPFPRRPA